MPRILLINPNSSAATTAMMVAIAQTAAAGQARVVGATARHSPPMIVDPDALQAAGEEVVQIGRTLAPAYTGIIISAFGDPGHARLSQSIPLPVVGLAQASMLEAATANRRFGVATVTPQLVPSIDAHAIQLGLGHLYCGTRLTQGDPTALAAMPARLIEALAEAVSLCIHDGAEAVIIGGGPLGDAATALATRFAIPIIAPIPAATRLLLAAIANEATKK